MRLTEKEIIERFRSLGTLYEPLSFQEVRENVVGVKGFRPDILAEIFVENSPICETLVEIASVPNPKTIRQKCLQLKAYIDELGRDITNLVPIIIAPYIAKKQAAILREQNVSWIDLCGNMTVRLPEKIYIERTGNKNLFPDTSPIKKIFQGTSSLVSRALLLKPEGFSSLYEIADFINNQNASITVSTVSRVLKSLEEELLITKSKSLISVTDREKLLEKLTEGYMNSLQHRQAETYRFAANNPRRVFLTLLNNGLDYVACGFYAARIRALAVTDQISICVKNVEKAKKVLSGIITPDAEFGNLNIMGTKDPCIWFNTTMLMYDATVDDIELYLEMMADTPRGPTIAKLLKQRILKDKK